MNSPPLPLVCAPGWSFQPLVWPDLREQLAPQQALAADLYHPPTLPERFIGIGHSLGVLWLLHHAADRLAALISINGFACLVRKADNPAGWPAPTIAAMQHNLKCDAAATVSAFRARCQLRRDHPDYGAPQHLHQGLEWLRTHDARPMLHTLTIPLLALYSRADAIVSPRLTLQQFGAVGRENWHHGERPGGSHALMFDEPEFCAEHIRRFCARYALAF
jgi:pimeloyl-[acyl-carrier protein] methyl ester esterase